MVILMLALLVVLLLAGSLYAVTRSLPSPTRTSLSSPEHAALEARIRALEESLERTDARVAEVAEAQEFTTNLLCERARSSAALPSGVEAVPTQTPLASAEDFLAYASALENERLATAGGRAFFTLRAMPQGLEITPESSGKPRVVRRETIQLFLDEYQRSGKPQPAEYQGITFDASYLLAIIARYQHDPDAG